MSGVRTRHRANASSNFSRRCRFLRRCSKHGATYEAISTRQRIPPTPPPKKKQKKTTQHTAQISKVCVDSAGNITQREFRRVAVRPSGYARLSRLRPLWVDSCQLRETNQSPLHTPLCCATTSGGFPRSDPCPPTSRLPWKKRAAPPCFVFWGGEKPQIIPTPNRAAIMFCRNVTRHSS